jgi:hypothetical protein
MFSPSFHVPLANTDAPARRIVTFAHQKAESYGSHLSPTEVEPIIPVVRELTQELSQSDIIGVSTDKNVLINQAIDAAKQAGLNQLNEFHPARVAGRLSAGYTEDPHALKFIEKHGLNQGISQFTSEIVDALTQISGKLSKELSVSKDELSVSKDGVMIKYNQKYGNLVYRHATLAHLRSKLSEYESGNYEHADRTIEGVNRHYPNRSDMPRNREACRARLVYDIEYHEAQLRRDKEQTEEQLRTGELQKMQIDQTKEALIATALLRKHALLKQVLPEFLRKAEASRAVLARSERTLQEQNYREAGLTGNDLTEQMKEYDQDSRDALKNQQFTDTSYATIKQLGEKVAGSLGMSTQQLSDALKEHAQKLSDAVNDAATLQSDATRDAATVQSNATRDAAMLQSGVAMQAARLATHMGSLQITQSENARLLLSDIYDKLSEPSPKKSGASDKINDTYHVVRSLEGGKDLLQTGVNLGTNLATSLIPALAAGCHIM